MKILFVCSCLEPARDGVGDYTRRLAAELEARGHRCFLLALADPYVEKAVSGGSGIPSSLRLPAGDPWPERVRRGKSFCAEVAPDWVSWQIVLYGYDPRGLSFGLGGRCREIAGDCRNQVMFHEIWIGEAEGASLKNKVVGRLQKHIIRDLLRRLRPRVVHTHTPLYRHLLSGLGYPAKILPLFGNIPLAPNLRSDWLKQKWPEGWKLIEMAGREAWWIFVMFGSIHPEWDGDEFLQKASAAAQRAGKKCLLISIGRPGAAGQQKLQALQKHKGDLWRFLNLGPQAEEDISQGLLTADFGVSASPPEYVFKSGTAVAMTEHGLPILITRSPARYRHCPPEIVSIGMKNVFTDFDLEVLMKTKAASLLPVVAGQFIEDLQGA